MVKGVVKYIVHNEYFKSLIHVNGKVGAFKISLALFITVLIIIGRSCASCIIFFEFVIESAPPFGIRSRVQVVSIQEAGRAYYSVAK